MSENQLVPVETNQGTLQQVPYPNSLDPFSDASLDGMYYTSIDTKDDLGRFKVLACFDSETRKIGDVLNTTIVATDVLVHMVNRVDATTGEITQLSRCVLVPLDGKCVAWTGVGARRALQRLGQTFGKPPWIKGLPLIFKEIAVGKDRRTHTITVDETKYQAIYGTLSPAAKQGTKTSK